MEKYKAIDFNCLFDMDEVWDEGISFWLLYKTVTRKQAINTNMKGCSISLVNSEERFMTLRDVIPETVCYIVHVCGKGYRIESLAEQAVSKKIDLEQILLTEGFKGEPWKKGQLAPKAEMISEIQLHENNGFCVFSPRKKEIRGLKISYHPSNGWMQEYTDETKVEWQRDVLVCYKLNKKLLNKVYLEEISCRVLDSKAFDYKKYFTDTLLDEQMCLNEDESMELYAFLEEKILDKNVKNYYVHGNVKPGTKRKEVLFHHYPEEMGPVLLLDGKRMSIRGYETERLFHWWINGQLENTRLKAAMIGVLEN
jgi:hypothetical protein